MLGWRSGQLSMSAGKAWIPLELIKKRSDEGEREEDGGRIPHVGALKYIFFLFVTGCNWEGFRLGTLMKKKYKNKTN